MISDQKIAERARALTGTPWELAERLRCLIQQPPREGDHTEGKIKAIKRRLAEDFGARRGWTLAAKPFDGEALAGRRIDSFFDRTRILATWPNIYFERFTCYSRDGKPAAIVTHPVRRPYSLTVADRLRLIDESAEHGLAVEFPDDYPDWTYPGEAVLVVFTRKQSSTLRKR